MSSISSCSEESSISSYDLKNQVYDRCNVYNWVDTYSGRNHAAAFLPPICEYFSQVFGEGIPSKKTAGRKLAEMCDIWCEIEGDHGSNLLVFFLQCIDDLEEEINWWFKNVSYSEIQEYVGDDKGDVRFYGSILPIDLVRMFFMKYQRTLNVDKSIAYVCYIAEKAHLTQISLWFQLLDFLKMFREVSHQVENEGRRHNKNRFVYHDSYAEYLREIERRQREEGEDYRFWPRWS